VFEVALPASGWRLLGTPAKPIGYAYRSSDPDDPIRGVELKNDRIVVAGGRAGWAFTLDEPQQSRIAVRLRVGGIGWCADAAARTAGSPPSTAKNDAPGRFVG
jgi:hypothetical protein